MGINCSTSTNIHTPAMQLHVICPLSHCNMEQATWLRPVGAVCLCLPAHSDTMKNEDTAVLAMKLAKQVREHLDMDVAADTREVALSPSWKAPPALAPVNIQLVGSQQHSAWPASTAVRDYHGRCMACNINATCCRMMRRN